MYYCLNFNLFFNKISMEVNSIVNHIGIWDDVLSKEECDKIIELYKTNEHRHRKGETIYGVTPETKLTTDLKLSPDLDKECDYILFKAFNKCFKEYIEKYNILREWIPEKISDTGYKIMKYERNKGVFNEHIDNNTSKFSIHRFLTSLIYLNTVEEGGETEFPNQGIVVKAKVGRVVMFPPFFTHPHKGNIPLSEDKYVSNGFFVNKEINLI